MSMYQNAEGENRWSVMIMKMIDDDFAAQQVLEMKNFPFAIDE